MKCGSVSGYDSLLSGHGNCSTASCHLSSPMVDYRCDSSRLECDGLDSSSISCCVQNGTASLVMNLERPPGECPPCEFSVSCVPKCSNVLSGSDGHASSIHLANSERPLGECPPCCSKTIVGQHRSSELVRDVVVRGESCSRNFLLMLRKNCVGYGVGISCIGSSVIPKLKCCVPGIRGSRVVGKQSVDRSSLLVNETRFVSRRLFCKSHPSALF